MVDLVPGLELMVLQTAVQAVEVEQVVPQTEVTVQPV
jgi:hypothetical protein